MGQNHTWGRNGTKLLLEVQWDIIPIGGVMGGGVMGGGAMGGGVLGINPKFGPGSVWIRSHDMQKGPSARAHRSKRPRRTTYLRIGDR